MLLKKEKKNAKFEGEYINIMPKEDEMLFIGKASQDCFYYYKGMMECRREIIDNYKNKPDTDYNQGFIPCLPVTEKYFECTTYNKFGNKLVDLEDDAKPFFKNFTTCFFEDLFTLGECRKYFDDVLRFYYRKPDSPLQKLYK